MGLCTRPIGPPYLFVDTLPIDPLFQSPCALVIVSIVNLSQDTHFINSAGPTTVPVRRNTARGRGGAGLAFIYAAPPAPLSGTGADLYCQHTDR
jgi:hypothetical protein